MVSNDLGSNYQRNLFRMNATIEEIETLVKAKYNVYEHRQTRKRSIACADYNVPQEIRYHNDFVTPTIQFSEVL